METTTMRSTRKRNPNASKISNTTNPVSTPKPKSKKLKSSHSEPKESSPATIAGEADHGGSNELGPDANGGGKPFHKFWTEGDEVTVLRAVIDFQSQTDRTPVVSDMPTFFDSIRASLHPQLTKDQVYNKIRSLKIKYDRGTGFNPSSASPHYRLLHDLSADIWGEQRKKPKEDDDGAQEQPSSGGEMEGDVSSVFPFLKSEVADYLKVNKGLEGCLKWIDPAKGKVLEDKFAHLWHGKFKAVGQRFDIYREIALLLACSASSL